MQYDDVVVPHRPLFVEFVFVDFGLLAVRQPRADVSVVDVMQYEVDARVKDEARRFTAHRLDSLLFGKARWFLAHGRMESSTMLPILQGSGDFCETGVMSQAWCYHAIDIRVCV